MTRAEEQSPGTRRTRLEALVHLLGDDDPEIVRAAWSHLERAGSRALPYLERAARGAEDVRVRAQARRFLNESARREVLTAWVHFTGRGSPDLEQGALLIARSEYPAVVEEWCRGELDRAAQILEKRLRTARSPDAAVGKIVEHLHGELGFSGNIADYHDPDNSYLNRVLERRVGIPVSLGTVYLLVARRLSFPLEGVGMPEHFLLKFRGSRGERFLDPFHGGTILSARDCAQRLEEAGIPFRARYLKAVSDREILGRSLGNLLRIYHARKDRRRFTRVSAMLRLLERASV